MAIRKEKRRGWVEDAIKKRKAVAYCVVAAFFALVFLLILVSHAAFARNFNISAGTPRLVLDTANFSSIYKTTITYGNLSNGTVYVYALGLDSAFNPVRVGFMNDSIINATRRGCNSYECLVNVNELDLQNNRSSYDLTVKIKWPDIHLPIEYAAVELYNNEYFYSGNGAYNTTT